MLILQDIYKFNVKKSVKRLCMLWIFKQKKSKISLSAPGVNNQEISLHKLIFVLLYLTIIIFLMTKSGVTTESGGRQNMFPSETRPYIDETASYDGYPQNAEKVNGRWAMVGFVALLGAYVTTGQIIPGIF